MNYKKIKNLALYTLSGVGVLALVWLGSNLFTRDHSYNVPRSTPSGYETGLEIDSPLSSAPSKDTVQTTEQAGDQDQRKVVKNGSLSLLVHKAEEAASQVKDIAYSLDGFVSHSRIYEVSEGVKAGTVTIRVPADRFNEAMDRIKELSVKVESENETTRDVTEEFVDLEAQLKNLEAEEERYLEVMERAESVEDILKVSERLSDVRGRIERIEGRIKYLSRQIDMASIQVSLTSEAEVEVFGIRWRPLYMVKKSFKGMLSGLTNYADSVVRFVFALPVIVLWLASIGVLVFVAVRIAEWVIKRLRRR